MSRRALMVRSARRWWPRFPLAGVVLAVAGVALFNGVAQFALVVLGGLVAMFSVVRGLDSDDYYRHDPPSLPVAPPVLLSRAGREAHGYQATIASATG